MTHRIFIFKVKKFQNFLIKRKKVQIYVNYDSLNIEFCRWPYLNWEIIAVPYIRILLSKILEPGVC